MDSNNKSSPLEVLTAKEERFEEIRKKTGLFIGPAAGLIIYFIPFGGLSQQAHLLAAIVSFTVVWWISEPVPIPVTALLATSLCVISGVGSVKDVLAPFADQIIFLFMGSFILAKAMSVHGLDKRFAFGIMSLKWVGNSSGRILFVFGAITAFISVWVSNTATTAMMLPIGLGIVGVMANLVGEKTGKSVSPESLVFGTGMMLMVAYSASVGGIGSPVGTPPNLIGIAMIEKFTHVKIHFFTWMAFAFPLLVIMFVFLFILMYFLHKPELKNISGSHDYIISERKMLGKWKRGEINSLLAFAITVFLWVLPGILSIIYGKDAWVTKLYSNILPEGIVAIMGAVLLFILPVNFREREFTIKWKDAVKINWGTLILFGGGLSLGNLMFETKLAEDIGLALTGFAGSGSVWILTLTAIYISILASEAASNTASANMVIPVMISVSVAAGLNPVPPAVGATLGASWGFMLPVSTPPNAIVYGTGMVPIRKMVRTGIIFDIAGGLIIWIGLRIMLPLLNLA